MLPSSHLDEMFMQFEDMHVVMRTVCCAVSTFCTEGVFWGTKVMFLKKQAMEIESKARTEAAEKTKLIRSLEMRLKHMHKLDSTQIIRIEQLERANKKQLHQIQELMLENERLVEQVRAPDLVPTVY